MHANETKNNCSHAKQAETDDRAEESNYDRYARNINEQYIQLKEVARYILHWQGCGAIQNWIENAFKIITGLELK